MSYLPPFPLKSFWFNKNQLELSHTKDHLAAVDIWVGVFDDPNLCDDIKS